MKCKIFWQMSFIVTVFFCFTTLKKVFLINLKIITVTWLFKMAKLCGSFLTVPMCRTFFAWCNHSLCMICTPIWNLKVHQLHLIAICTISQNGNEIWQLMKKLVQFTVVHFPDPNPNSYDNLNNMKLDLNVSTKVKFRANDQGL